MCVCVCVCVCGMVLLMASAPDDGESSVMMQPTNQPTPWSRVLCEKLTNSPSASQEIFCILWNVVVHYHVYRTAHHLPISRARLIQSVPFNHVSLWSKFVLFSHLCLSYPYGLFLLYFSIKILYAFLFSSHTIYMPSSFHSPPFDRRTIYDEQYRLWSSSLCSFLHSPFISSS